MWRRFTIAHEVLPAMKLVKYYGWERFFEDRILTIRGLERRLLGISAALKGINICLVFTVRSPWVTFLCPVRTASLQCNL